MNEIAIFGLSALFICFSLATFFLSRIPLEIFTNDYDYKLDPLLAVFFTMLLGGIGCYYFFPDQYDTIKDYTCFDFIVPFIFAGIIYFCYLLGVNSITNIVLFLLSLAISFMQPDDFRLFDGHLIFWQDRIIVAILLFIISKGLGILNGLGVIASAQFIVVMAITAILAYLGVIPKVLAIIGMAYTGAMLAFAFYSWPPEKLVITNGGFVTLGFILGCFMLNVCVEHSGASMFIASSFLFTEVGYAIYKRFILNIYQEHYYMNTSYYDISEDGLHEKPVVIGVLKIFFINILLAVLQVAAKENVALPVFSVALNMWMLSVLAGDATSIQIFSITRWGFSSIKKALNYNNNKEKIQTEIIESEEVFEIEEPIKEVKKSTKTKKTTKTKQQKNTSRKKTSKITSSLKTK
ncbi:MAG: hypothetical protein IKW58_00345 [Alphaproteobacteria bacterium]|nr:hypothetical protein [Alphaproteobacteria bacterium]